MLRSMTSQLWALTKLFVLEIEKSFDFFKKITHRPLTIENVHMCYLGIHSGDLSVKLPKDKLFEIYLYIRDIQRFTLAYCVNNRKTMSLLNTDQIFNDLGSSRDAPSSGLQIIAMVLK